jgi:hypothetical protein
MTAPAPDDARDQQPPAAPRAQPTRIAVFGSLDATPPQTPAPVRPATPSIAGPILARARASERLTAAQERRVLERLRSGDSGAGHAGPAHGLS